jgi:hypothetical protein
MLNKVYSFGNNEWTQTSLLSAGIGAVAPLLNKHTAITPLQSSAFCLVFSLFSKAVTDLSMKQEKNKYKVMAVRILVIGVSAGIAVLALKQLNTFLFSGKLTWQDTLQSSIISSTVDSIVLFTSKKDNAVKARHHENGHKAKSNPGPVVKGTESAPTNVDNPYKGILGAKGNHEGKVPANNGVEKKAAPTPPPTSPAPNALSPKQNREEKKSSPPKSDSKSPLVNASSIPNPAAATIKMDAEILIESAEELAEEAQKYLQRYFDKKDDFMEGVQVKDLKINEGNLISTVDITLVAPNLKKEKASDHTKILNSCTKGLGNIQKKHPEFFVANFNPAVAVTTTIE